MAYKGKVISGDCHIDIPWLPSDLFTSNAPAHLRSKMPHVVDTKEGKQWFAEDVLFGWVAGAGIGLKSGGWDPYVPGYNNRLDRMEQFGFFSDGQKGRLHPTTPELRVKDQNTDGVSGEVLYGILALAGGFANSEVGEEVGVMGDEVGPAYGLTDPEAITCAYDIYGQWVADFSKTHPDRLAGLACLSAHDPQTAAKQLRKAARLGLKGAEFNVSRAASPIYHKSWDVLWAAASETGLPVSFHTTGLQIRTPEKKEMSEYRWVFGGLSTTVFQLSGAEFLPSVIYSGACDRYPNFKFVLGECGIGWIPYVLYRMDEEYDRHITLQGLSLKPREFWNRQGYSTFQIEHLTNELVDLVGEDNIMWGSDYPHPDGIWPDSRRVIDENLGQLERRRIKKIVCDNTAKLYGFPI